MTRVLGVVGCTLLLVMVLTHVAERWHLFPSMGWGQPASPGHYLDLVGAVGGVAFLVAALAHRISK